MALSHPATTKFYDNATTITTTSSSATVNNQNINAFSTTNTTTSTTTNNSSNNNYNTNTSWLSPVVLGILWTETAERFAYFGFRAILVLYFTSSLGYSESTSIALYAYTTSFAYLTPLLGALLADGAWGCYTTILCFGSTYAVGLMMMTYGASLATHDDAESTRLTNTTTTTAVGQAAAVALAAATPASLWQQFFSFGGLLLVCIGTGGIKPCVSAFGANQVSTSPPVEKAKSTTLDEYGVDEQQQQSPATSVTSSSSTITAEQRHVQAFFAYFYFCINVGAVLSIATIPIVRQYHGFAAAFGIPTLFMCGAMLLFWSKRNEYKHQPPSNTLASTLLMCCWLIHQRLRSWCSTHTPWFCNAITTVWRPCRNLSHRIWLWSNNMMRTNKKTSRSPPLPPSMGRPALVPTRTSDDDDDDDDIKDHEHGRIHHNTVATVKIVTTCDTEMGDDESEGSSKCRLVRSESNHDYGSSTAGDKHHHHHDLHHHHQHASDSELMQDAEQALRVLPIMAMFPIFWMLYDQQGSVWTLQATRMRLHGLQPEQLTLVNPIEIMIFIPLFQSVIYPALAQRGWNLSPIHRIRMGMVLAALSFFASGLLESAIQRSESQSQTSTAIPQIPPPSVFWQLIQITLLAVSEILVSVTGLEWAYDTAPHRIKALLMAMFLLTTAVGDFGGGILYSTVFQSWNRATILHVCATLLLVNRALLDLVVQQSSLSTTTTTTTTQPILRHHGDPDTNDYIVGSVDVPIISSGQEQHEHQFKELTSRSSSLVGMELPPVS